MDSDIGTLARWIQFDCWTLRLAPHQIDRPNAEAAQTTATPPDAIDREHAMMVAQGNVSAATYGFDTARTQRGLLGRAAICGYVSAESSINQICICASHGPVYD